MTSGEEGLLLSLSPLLIFSSFLPLSSSLHLYFSLSALLSALPFPSLPPNFLHFLPSFLSFAPSSFTPSSSLSCFFSFTFYYPSLLPPNSSPSSPLCHFPFLLPSSLLPPSLFPSPTPFTSHLRVSIAVKIHHDHRCSYKGKCLIGTLLTVHRFTPL